MLSHRIPTLIDPEQYARLRRESELRGVPMGAIVREAIELALPDDVARRRRALDHLWSLDPIPVPDHPAELEREIQKMHGRMPAS